MLEKLPALYNADAEVITGLSVIGLILGMDFTVDGDN